MQVEMNTSSPSAPPPPPPTTQTTVVVPPSTSSLPASSPSVPSLPSDANAATTSTKRSVEQVNTSDPHSGTGDQGGSDQPSTNNYDLPNDSTTLPTANSSSVPDFSVKTQESTAAGGGGDDNDHNDDAHPAAKKRKLSPASKETKQQEKETKERQRVEEKAKKEEERKAKEEEKRRKDSEREEERKKKEEKKKVKDEEKAAKEGEKKKKEEEKMKKEKMQMKLNSFFAKPAAPAKATNPVGNGDPSTHGDGLNGDHKGTVSDYQREFPEFFVQSHTTVAPVHRFERDSEALRHVREKVDACLRPNEYGIQQEPVIFSPTEPFRIMPYKRRWGKQIPVKEILMKMQNQDQEGSSSTEGSSDVKTASKFQGLLRKVSMKSLKFKEDVRPPYQGTFTRYVPEPTARKLSRNPFSRALPEADYDYDSEAEWEEPEEGEELDSEEEEETSEDGDDDMEGFLDDEEDYLQHGRRRPIVGDLEPICSGLCWEEDGPHPELQAYRIETIPPSIQFPIDPFSTAYWQTPNYEQGPTKGSNAQSAAAGRSSLHAFAVTSSAQAAASGMHDVSEGALQGMVAGKARRPFPPELFSEFKEVVEGSDLTKAGLVEILKKRFPKISKDILKDTLNQTARRVGTREAEKKWVCQ